MLYSNKTDILLFNTTVLECNDRPKLRYNPTNADARRFVDVLFGSSFTDNPDHVNVLVGWRRKLDEDEGEPPDDVY